MLSDIDCYTGSLGTFLLIYIYIITIEHFKRLGSRVSYDSFNQ